MAVVLVFVPQVSIVWQIMAVSWLKSRCDCHIYGNRQCLFEDLEIGTEIERWAYFEEQIPVSKFIEVGNFVFNPANQFVIFKPLNYCFEEATGFDLKASFASRPKSRLIRRYNEPGDITKEFW